MSTVQRPLATGTSTSSCCSTSARTIVHDMRRDDLQQRYAGTTRARRPRARSPSVCFMPLTFGGRIRTLDDIADATRSPAPTSASINTAGPRRSRVRSPRPRERFGSQCIVVSIDALRHAEGTLRGVRRRRQASRPACDPADWAARGRAARRRRDLPQLDRSRRHRPGLRPRARPRRSRRRCRSRSSPAAASGRYEHFPHGDPRGRGQRGRRRQHLPLLRAQLSAAKRVCLDAGVADAPSELGSRWFPREPELRHAGRGCRGIAHRLQRAREPVLRGAPSAAAAPIRWCTHCVYPSISAAPMEFDDDGVCMGCRMAEVKAAIPRRRVGPPARAPAATSSSGTAAGTAAGTTA